MKKAVWIFETFIIIILSIPLAILPLRLANRVGELFGLIAYYLWGSRREIAIDNIKRAVLSRSIIISKPPERIIKDNFKNLGKSLAEVIKIYYGVSKNLIDKVEIEGIEYVNRAKSKGKGILFLTGHCGNWELMSIAASLKLFPLAIVARPIKNPYINNFIENIRQRYGNKVIYKKDAIRPIVQILNSNGIVGILMDQAVFSDEGFVIDFLGRGAWTTKMPALIARKTGAAVLPAFIHRYNRTHRIIIYPEIRLSDTEDLEMALVEDTKKFSNFIEEYIREHPEEWLWIHRRWKRV